MTPADPFYPLEAQLRTIPNATVLRNVPLRVMTRFGTGGAAALVVESRNSEAFEQVRTVLADEYVPWVMLGEGSNVVASDLGYHGVITRYTASRIARAGDLIMADAGASLQSLVDYANHEGLEGLHTMTGIPGCVGAAIYGNAGAYGHSIMEFVESVRMFDGKHERFLDRAGCEFQYRESIFKRKKDWTVLAAALRLKPGDSAKLTAESARIRAIRDAKYPPSMRCAGSIFKNCLFAQLPERVRSEVPAEMVREGKVPSAWFLEQVGAKGIRRGGIQVAAYHANLIYNDDDGRATDVRRIIDDLKDRVRARFAFDLEEEVQYVGFS